MFWILYHNQYSTMDRFGGGYGNYPQLPEGAKSKEVRENDAVFELIRSHAKRLEVVNGASGGGGGGSGGGGVRQQQRGLLAATDVPNDVCYWAPPVSKGVGCASLAVELAFGRAPGLIMKVNLLLFVVSMHIPNLLT